MKLIFATNNQNKIQEIRQVVGNLFEIITLKEAGINIDIPEPYDTLEANAIEKSTVIHQLTGLSCFSEDTGLEIDALHGEPGVKVQDMQETTEILQLTLIKFYCA